MLSFIARGLVRRFAPSVTPLAVRPALGRNFVFQSQLLYPTAKTTKAVKSASSSVKKSLNSSLRSAKATATKTKAKPKSKVASKKVVAKPNATVWRQKKVKAVPKPKKEYTPRPKAIHSALPLFIRAEMAKSKYKSPSDTIARFTELAVVWRSMSGAEKQPFFDQLEAHKIQHAKDIADWEAATSEKGVRQERRASNKRRRQAAATRLAARGLAEIERPILPYIHFTKESWANHQFTGGVTALDAAKQLGQRWREMSEVEKAPYYALYDHQKLKWDEAVKHAESKVAHQ